MQHMIHSKSIVCIRGSSYPFQYQCWAIIVGETYVEAELFESFVAQKRGTASLAISCRSPEN